MKKSAWLILGVASLLLFIFISPSCKVQDVDELFGADSTAATLSTSGSACAGALVAGTYKKDSTLNSTHYAEIIVTAKAIANYIITTDTVNGIFFKGSGTFSGVGSNPIKLRGYGKISQNGTFTYTVKYGNQKCTFTVTTLNANGGGTSSFSFVNNSGNCTPATVAGSYLTSVPLTSSNTVIVQANVTVVGTYNIVSPTVNDVTFSASGSFTNTGLQNITLVGSGTPTSAGVNSYALSNTGSGCSFSITYVNPGPASFSLVGSPNTCTNFIVGGIFTQGAALNTSNKVTISVNVTSIGSYTLSTNTVNGITFTKTGVFTSIGNQTVDLMASGTPTNSGSHSFTIQGASGGCSFTVNTVGPATFTFVGAPGNCTGAVVNGTYVQGVLLSSSNTVELTVDVSVVGSYLISTNTNAGISFSKSGIFSTTGVQTVILNGSGTPTSAGNQTITIANGCTFDVAVETPAVPTGTFTCNINGVGASFNFNASAATSYGGFPALICEGSSTAAGGNTINFQIQNNSLTPIGTGTYNVTSILGSDYLMNIEMEYGGETWLTQTYAPQDPYPAFTIVVNSLTGNRAKGTFSGQLINSSTGQLLSVTNGIFDLPIQ